MDIKLAVSRSGHDKDSMYVIIKEEAKIKKMEDIVRLEYKTKVDSSK